MSESRATPEETADPGPVIVFAGPCLPPSVSLPEGVERWPPAQRGDVLRALSRRPSALVLLDGYYYQVPSVTHKELLYALDTGVPVVGGASMGALRAAEMERFGMVGVGWVFEQFRDEILEGDDEVAVLHADAEHGYRPLTMALVELRHALASDDSREAEELLAELSEMPFTRRDPRRVRERITDRLGAEVAERVLATVARDGIKGRDARGALATAMELAGRSASPRRRLPTTFLVHYQEWYLGPLSPVASGDAASEPTYLEAWHMVQLFHPRAEDFVTALRRRYLLASAAHDAGLEVAPVERAARAEGLAGRLAAAGVELPWPEVEEEAETDLLAVRARDHFGSSAAAAERLAPRFGLELRGAEAALLALLGRQDDLMPAWLLVRAFVRTAALAPALAAARSALQVARAHRRWARGRRLTEAAARTVAARLLGCSEGEVRKVAARRGLFESHGYYPGTREAVELVAVAERLPRPVNDYPARLAALRSAPLALEEEPASPSVTAAAR